MYTKNFSQGPTRASSSSTNWAGGKDGPGHSVGPEAHFGRNKSRLFHVSLPDLPLCVPKERPAGSQWVRSPRALTTCTQSNGVLALNSMFAVELLFAEALGQVR